MIFPTFTKLRNNLDVRKLTEMHGQIFLRNICKSFHIYGFYKATKDCENYFNDLSQISDLSSFKI